MTKWVVIRPVLKTPHKSQVTSHIRKSQSVTLTKVSRSLHPLGGSVGQKSLFTRHFQGKKPFFGACSAKALLRFGRPSSGGVSGPIFSKISQSLSKRQSVTPRGGFRQPLSTRLVVIRTEVLVLSQGKTLSTDVWACFFDGGSPHLKA